MEISARDQLRCERFHDASELIKIATRQISRPPLSFSPQIKHELPSGRNLTKNLLDTFVYSALFDPGNEEE